jgi:hypothetical protein
LLALAGLIGAVCACSETSIAGSNAYLSCLQGYKC